MVKGGGVFLDLVYNKYKKHLLFDIGLLINTKPKEVYLQLYVCVEQKKKR